MSFQLKFKEFLKSDQTITSSEDMDQHMSDSEDRDDTDYGDRCEKLMKRCETIKLENERLINNIYKIKKLSQKYRKHKKILINRLVKHRDDYKSYDLPLFLDKDESTQQPSNDTKAKNLMTKSNSNTTNMSSKCKTNNNRNESTSSGNTSVAPKKPINPYLMFCQENRSSLQEKYQSKHNCEMTHQELTKALAQQWHELSVTAKQVYYNLFNNDKIRYENEMKLFAAKESNESCD